jgi:hypothetical protein
MLHKPTLVFMGLEIGIFCIYQLAGSEVKEDQLVGKVLSDLLTSIEYYLMESETSFTINSTPTSIQRI